MSGKSQVCMLQISRDMSLVTFFQYHEYQVCFSDILL